VPFFLLCKKTTSAALDKYIEPAFQSSSQPSNFFKVTAAGLPIIIAPALLLISSVFFFEKKSHTCQKTEETTKTPNDAPAPNVTNVNPNVSIPNTRHNLEIIDVNDVSV
jgi:hypothetical protein